MDIKLKKGKEYKIIKYGPTLFPVFLILPICGFLIALFLWFRRGQYKEFFCQLIILLLIGLVGSIITVLVNAVSSPVAMLTFIVTFIAYFAVFVYFMGSSVKNANMWRLKALIALGYMPEDNEIYKLALEYKKPKWLFFSSF